MDSTIDNLLTTLRKHRSQLCRQHIDSQLEQLYKSKTSSPNDSSSITAAGATTIAGIDTITKTALNTSTTPAVTTNIATETTTNPNAITSNTRSKLSSEIATIDCFLSNIKHLEKYDSEATESTSSDDSYDELEDFSHQDIPPKRRIFQNQLTSSSSSKQSNHQQNHLHTMNQSSSQGTSSNLYNTTMPSNSQDYSNLKKRAIWRWANERSRLACRWTWLQAQVADLEFRIRGQNDATLHARAYKTPPLPPKLPENSCSRTVPINKDFRKRRLIKASQILTDSNRKLVKYSHIPCICSSLPQTVAPCLSCNGRYNYLKQMEGENLPMSERISLLDPCCHPVLSFPDDLTIGLQLSYLLKQETINRKPTKGKPGRKKGSTAANLAAAAAAAAASAANGGGDNGQSNRKGKYYGIVGRPPGKQSQTMITSNKLRRKYRKHSNNTNNYNPNNWPIGPTTNNPSSRNTIRRNKRIRRASSMNESSMYTGSSNHHHHYHHHHPSRPSYCSNNNNSSAQNVTRRRRSEQSAYDIDNIVIPFSIAATTRVEVLEYKEIMTPSWRVWENGTSNHNQTENDIDEDVEDTSDEAYINRHSKGESEEKKRFSLKPPKNTTSNSNNTPTTPTITTNSTNNTTTTTSTTTTSTTTTNTIATNSM